MQRRRLAARGIAAQMDAPAFLARRRQQGRGKGEAQRQHQSRIADAARRDRRAPVIQRAGLPVDRRRRVKIKPHHLAVGRHAMHPARQHETGGTGMRQVPADARHRAHAPTAAHPDQGFQEGGGVHH
jgi:hypothetical protein